MKTHFVRAGGDGWVGVSGPAAATVIVTDTQNTPIERILCLLNQTLVRARRDGRPIFATIQEIGPGRSL